MSGRKANPAGGPAYPLMPAAEVFLPFLKLGLTSFGGPVAHLGYFRAEFVECRKWLDETAFADILALCQFLPGPASSQAGITRGTVRAGLPGALAAWTGFSPRDFALTLIAFILLMFWQVPPWAVVTLGAIGTAAIASLV
jgi:chromate transporter